MDLKTQEINGNSCRKEDAWGVPGRWGGSPRLFLTAFPIDILRFEGHFSCPVWVLRRDSFRGRVWYGLRTNLDSPQKNNASWLREIYVYLRQYCGLKPESFSRYVSRLLGVAVLD